MHAYAFQPITDGEEDSPAIQIFPEVTPRLQATIFHSSGNFKFKIFPDTGGAASIISRDMINKKKIPIAPCTNIPDFQAVNGTKLSIEFPHTTQSTRMIQTKKPL